MDVPVAGGDPIYELKSLNVRHFFSTRKAAGRTRTTAVQVPAATAGG